MIDINDESTWGLDGPTPPSPVFWTMRDDLKTIYQGAQAAIAAPWGTLAYTLSRVLASTAPNVQLPPMGNAREGGASLNLLTILVGRSADGKGLARNASRGIFKIIDEPPELPIGTGEGISRQYGTGPKWKRDKISLQFRLPEIEAITEAAGGKTGNYLMSVLRQVYSGEDPGKANAAAETTRIVPDHTYRCCVVIYAQYSNAGVLLNKKQLVGGTVTRFMWAETNDPDSPDALPLMPEPIVWEPPEIGKAGIYSTVTTGGRASLDDQPPIESVLKPVTYMGLTDEIRSEIIQAQQMRNRDKATGMQIGHRLLTKEKIAAGFALMDNRMNITNHDWMLAGVFCAHQETAQANAKKIITAEDREERHHKAVSQGYAESTTERTRDQLTVVELARKIHQRFAGQQDISNQQLRDTASRHHELLGDAKQLLIDEHKMTAKPKKEGSAVMAYRFSQWSEKRISDFSDRSEFGIGSSTRTPLT